MDIAKLIDVENHVLMKFIMTVLLAVGIYGIRALIVKDLLSRKKIPAKIRRRWIVITRNTALFLFVFSLCVIWFQQLRAVAAAVIVVAGAIVLATKEFFLNVMGFFYLSGSHSFSIGDRIEFDDVRGDVIDQTLTRTTVLEIGPESKTHQYTGRMVYIPNQKFLANSVRNESDMGDYVFHSIVVPLMSDSEWERREEALLKAANDVCSEYLDEAKKRMKDIASRHSLDAPGVEPRIHIQIPDPGRINLVLRVPLSSRRRGRIEQVILRKYVEYLKDMTSTGKLEQEVAVLNG